MVRPAGGRATIAIEAYRDIGAGGAAIPRSQLWRVFFFPLYLQVTRGGNGCGHAPFLLLFTTISLELPPAVTIVQQWSRRQRNLPTHYRLSVSDSSC
jgi:hypothetical protein